MMLCPEAMTCIRMGDCTHAVLHKQRSDCKIIFDRCPICIDEEIFLNLKEFIMLKKNSVNVKVQLKVKKKVSKKEFITEKEMQL